LKGDFVSIKLPSYGFCPIANTVYVSKKHIGQDTHIYRDLDRYLKYKVSLYASRFYSNHGREVFLGAFDAWRNRSKPIFYSSIS
jgi:hypothetical protein